jgi:hypothetical protein
MQPCGLLSASRAERKLPWLAGSKSDDHFCGAPVVRPKEEVMGKRFWLVAVLAAAIVAFAVSSSPVGARPVIADNPASEQGAGSANNPKANIQQGNFFCGADHPELAVIGYRLRELPPLRHHGQRQLPSQERGTEDGVQDRTVGQFLLVLRNLGDGHDESPRSREPERLADGSGGIDAILRHGVGSDRLQRHACRHAHTLTDHRRRDQTGGAVRPPFRSQAAAIATSSSG